MKLEYVVLKSAPDKWHVLLTTSATTKKKCVIVASWNPLNIGYRLDRSLYEDSNLDWQAIDLSEKSNADFYPT